MSERCRCQIVALKDLCDREWMALSDFVRTYGPACPDRGCEHAHCAEVRRWRAQIDAMHYR